MRTVSKQRTPRAARHLYINKNSRHIAIWQAVLYDQNK